MTTAFVLSGGGSLGAVQVGMLQALAERNVRPDLLIGTSVGAVNAAYLAGHGTGPQPLAHLARLWRRIRREDIFPFDPLRHVLATTGARPSLYSGRGLRRLVEANLTFSQLEDAEIPVHLVATDLLSGCEVLMSSGDAASAVLASAAIPGVLPPVLREGRVLIDGATSDNAPLSQAVALGADEIYVLPTGYACLLAYAPRTALGNAMHALTLLIEQRLIEEVAAFPGPGRLAVLPPLCPLGVSSTDFTHADELIERAHRATGRWLDSGGPDLPAPERFLSLHSHRPPQRAAAVPESRSSSCPRATPS
jgi:NTE family protein